MNNTTPNYMPTEINYKRLDEFRTKKFYGQLLAEYQALLTLQDYLPAPASIRKAIRNIALHFGIDIVDHPNEGAVIFELRHNGQPGFVTVESVPQFGGAAVCPPERWRCEDNKYTLLEVSGRDKAARTYAKKVALAALSQAVLSERNGWVGDIIPKLMDDAELIFKEFVESAEAQQQAEPQSAAEAGERLPQNAVEIAAILREMEKEYADLYADGEISKPKPTDKDRLIRLSQEGYGKGQSTLTKIKSAMKAGRI